MRAGRLALLVGVALASLPAIPPAAAEDHIYWLKYKPKPEKGQEFEMPMAPYFEYFDCYHAMKKTKVGDTIPRGVMVDANGHSYSHTILSARCVRDDMMRN